MLVLAGGQVESLFDEALLIAVRELPGDLARLDALLSGSGLLAPIAAGWEASARERGRPTIAMAMFVRLMVVKQRTGWGYETLVREVSDSLHLRRFVGRRVMRKPRVWPLRRALGRAGAAPSASLLARFAWSSSLTGPKRSNVRSPSVWLARRSPTGLSHSPIPTRDRSARASSANATSSATSSSSRRSPRTRAAARAACSCPQSRESARPTSPSCSPRPSESSTGSVFVYARPPSMAASTPVRPTACCPRRPPSSPGANSPSHLLPRNDWPVTASAPRAASATSNAATGCADHDSDATTARECGSAGGSSPTTSTPSQPEPSRTPETLPAARHPATNSQKRPRDARPFHSPGLEFFRGK